jgi:outer membrane PBP1 activator LpoA protein
MINRFWKARYFCFPRRAGGSIALAALLAMLVSCASVGPAPDQVQTPAQALEVASNMKTPVDAQRYLLKTADSLQSKGDHRDARLLLQSTLMTPPDGSLKTQYLMLAMTGAVALDDREWAEQVALSLRPDQFREYREELQSRAASLQFQTFRLAGSFLQAALSLMEAPQGLVLENRDRNDQIWQLLKRTPASALESLSRSAIGFDVQGWTELALMLREPGMSLEQQARQIRNWQSNWGDHPAAEKLPSELALIASLAQERPQKIALALPLSGPLASAGRAVRNGFLAAFYADEAASKESVEITVTDTHGKVFGNLYEELQAEKTDLVVGPLEKEALASVINKNLMPVPLLALNYYDGSATLPEGFYQFGLSPEDEARQIAERLQTTNHDQVVVLIPEGDWGNRVERALLGGIKAGDGTVLRVERFFRTDNLREVTADMLGINTSRQRAIEVERAIGMNLEFEPRRRQDIDAIVMVAEPTVARQLNPLFGFYFAGNLPVYSPSSVYEGQPDPGRDRDLNGVRFTDIPWVLENENPFRKKSLEAFPDMGGQLGRLFAMGADAYNLSARLTLMRKVAGSSVDGLTGKLTMSENGRVQREQLWAIFRKGEPALLPEPTDGGETVLEEITDQSL